MGGGMIPMRWYLWGFLLGAFMLWSMFSGHLKWHKADYACTGKYVYSQPTEWYTKLRLGSLEWRGSNSVYGCPVINQVPLNGGKAQNLDSSAIPAGASQNWTGQ